MHPVLWSTREAAEGVRAPRGSAEEDPLTQTGNSLQRQAITSRESLRCMRPCLRREAGADTSQQYQGNRGRV